MLSADSINRTPRVFSRTQVFKRIPWFFCLLLFASCSSFQKNSSKVNFYIRNQQYDKAIEILKPLAEDEGDDQLVYLLDYGMALHLSDRYDESIKALLKADDIASIKDYHSISRIAGSILLNEGMVQYKGDDFEKVFIHIYLALNFLMKNDLEGALVETRRTNEILQKFRDEAKKNYEQNGLAFYLGAIIWEADQKFDDARIAYEDAYRQTKLKEIQKDLENLKNTSYQDTDGELIFIYQQGQGPVKKPHPSFARIPKLYPQSAVGIRARITVDGGGVSRQIISRKIYDVTTVAIKTLDDQYAGLIAKRVAGLVAKQQAAKKVGKKNDALGAVTWIGLNLADQADLRQWSNLPASFQIARIKLPPGEYKISAESLNYQGSPLQERLSPVTIKIGPRKKVFFTWRSFN